MRRAKVFFAIPCGDFYSIQSRVISAVAARAGVQQIVIEDHAQTANLWDKIAEQIQQADLFVADISSKSPNVILELGYALRMQDLHRVGVFVSENVAVPVDLQGLVLQKYGSFSEFQEKLVEWLCDRIPRLSPSRFERLKVEPYAFEEHFKNQDWLLRRWWFPYGASWLLSHEGLRFTNTHFPIMTTNLALLGDCEFEFRARIDSKTIGWAVKGTRRFDQVVPSFCVMFNLSDSGTLTPHVWNVQHPHLQTHYQVFPSVTVSIKTTDEGWFNILTRVRGDAIEVENDGRLLFSADFSHAPYKPYYVGFQNKEGQVGFRCHPDEQATVNWVRVREL